MKQKFLSALIIIFLAGVVVFQCVSIKNIEASRNQQTTQEAERVDVTAEPQTTTQPQTVVTQPQTTTQPTTAGNDENETTAAEDPAESDSSMPSNTKEIIDKYTMLVDKFKQEKPAYSKKEYQALPEEYHNFSSVINKVLDVAAGYMTTEDEAEILVRSAGAQEILNDMPVHGTEKGCALTDYDAVEWAKCEDLGDGTYKLSFSLKEEINAEPTPADTLVPVSAHGAVMQPMAFNDIKAEVDGLISKVPGIALNQLDLFYRDCEFICVYNPETDEVLSITHYIVIDIVVNADVFGKTIDGSARLLNDMFIYDITW